MTTLATTTTSSSPLLFSSASSSSIFITARDIKSLLNSINAKNIDDPTNSNNKDSNKSEGLDSNNNNNDASSQQQQGHFTAFEKEDFLGETNQKSLRQLIDVLGFKIAEYRVRYDKQLKTTGVFVNFDKEEGAKTAVDTLDGEKFFDFILTVNHESFVRKMKPKLASFLAEADSAGGSDENNSSSSLATTAAGNNSDLVKMCLMDGVNFSTSPHPLLPLNHLMPAFLQMSPKLLDLIQQHQKNAAMKIMQKEKEKKNDIIKNTSDEQQTQLDDHQASSFFDPLLKQLHQVQSLVCDSNEELEKLKAEKVKVLFEINNGPTRRLAQLVLSLDHKKEKSENDTTTTEDAAAAAASLSNANDNNKNNNTKENPLRQKAHYPLSFSSSSSSSPSSTTPVNDALSTTSAILYFSNVILDSYLVSYILEHLIVNENLPVQRWGMAPCVTSYDPEAIRRRELHIRASAKEKLFGGTKKVALLIQLASEAAAAVFLERVLSLSGENQNFVYSMNVIVGDGKGGKTNYLQRCLVWTFEDAVKNGFIRQEVVKEFAPGIDFNNGGDSHQNVFLNVKVEQKKKEGGGGSVDEENNADDTISNNNKKDFVIEKKKRQVLPHHEVKALFGGREAEDVMRDLRKAGI